MSIDPRAIIAAQNNADLYGAVFAAHRVAYDRFPHAFVAAGTPPPYYSHVTVLSPGHAGKILHAVETLASRGASRIGVKDSFCELSSKAHGFEQLFRASWIWRAPFQTAAPGWERVSTKADLILWEAAWASSGSPAVVRMFPASLLDRPNLHFLGVKRNDAFEAGCIANVSADCIGLSNVFAADPKADVFLQAAAAVGAIAPHLPIVGYEAGDALIAAQEVGFCRIGDLRVVLTAA